MDDDEYVEKKRPKDRYHCFYDVHVNSATVGIFLLKTTIAVTCVVRNIRVDETVAAGALILYISTILLALFGYLCTQPKLYFPFIVADIIFKVIFGVFAFGLLLLGPTMVKDLDLFKKGYYGLSFFAFQFLKTSFSFPFWFCMFMVVFFFLDVYALNIVCRSQRYLVRKLERSLPRMDAINPSTDSMHDSL